MTSGLQKSVSIKNYYLLKFVRLKDASKTEESQIRYKECRNLLLTLLKK